MRLLVEFKTSCETVQSLGSHFKVFVVEFCCSALNMCERRFMKSELEYLQMVI